MAVGAVNYSSADRRRSFAADRGSANAIRAALSPRASIAVMPFVEQPAVAAGPGGTADALAYDVITRLAKLRNLFVIAPGTCSR